MAKQKTAFVCTDCGSDYVKWQGQCGDCGAWNTLTEIKLGPEKGSGRAREQVRGKIDGLTGTRDVGRVLKDVKLEDRRRVSSGGEEFDGVVGGG